MHNDYRYSQLSHSYVQAIFGLGLESLWEIKVQFSEIPITFRVFLLSDDKVICTLVSFSSSLYQNPLNSRLIHKAFYRFRSPSFDGFLTDWAKPRPDGGILLCESSVQVAKLTLAKEMKRQSLLSRPCWKWEIQRIESRKKIENNQDQLGIKENFFDPAEIQTGCHTKNDSLLSPGLRYRSPRH